MAHGRPGAERTRVGVEQLDRIQGVTGFVHSTEDGHLSVGQEHCFGECSADLELPLSSTERLESPGRRVVELCVDPHAAGSFSPTTDEHPSVGEGCHSCTNFGRIEGGDRPTAKIDGGTE